MEFFMWTNFGQNLRTIYEEEPACVFLALLNISIIRSISTIDNWDKSEKQLAALDLLADHFLPKRIA